MPKYNGYKTKKEVKESKNDFCEMIKYIRKELKGKYTFVEKLVGSAKRNLVLEHHNKGFDCDYQIMIFNNPFYCKKTKVQTTKSSDLKTIKNDFMEKFDEHNKNEKYSNCENSTKAITIKNKDINNSKITNSFDIVLIIRVNIENSDKFEERIIEYNKPDDTYQHNELFDLKDFNERYKSIKGNDRVKELRKNYEEKKNNDKDNKKSVYILKDTVYEMTN